MKFLAKRGKVLWHGKAEWIYVLVFVVDQEWNSCTLLLHDASYLIKLENMWWEMVISRGSEREKDHEDDFHSLHSWNLDAMKKYTVSFTIREVLCLINEKLALFLFIAYLESPRCVWFHAAQESQFGKCNHQHLVARHRVFPTSSRLLILCVDLEWL